METSLSHIQIQNDSAAPVADTITDSALATNQMSTSDEPGAPLAIKGVDPNSIAAQLLNGQISLANVGDALNCPQEWVDEAATHPCFDLVREFLSRLSPTAKTVPWLITSMSKDLSGAERSDSEDHLKGLAMDVAPMLTEDIVLPDDPQMLGLAWNIKSLIVISEGQWGDMPLFVEGDHIHFSSSIKPLPKGELPIMWSDSSAYQSIRDQEHDPILSRLRNSFWIWSTPTLTMRPPSAKTQREITDILSRSTD